MGYEAIRKYYEQKETQEIQPELPFAIGAIAVEEQLEIEFAYA